MSALAQSAPYGERTVTLTRMLDAPRDLVWRAWTDPKHLAHWFGPKGFTSSVPELDVRVGGSLRIVMHGPDGNDYPMKGVFSDVKPGRAGRQDQADAAHLRERPGAAGAANARRHGGGLEPESGQACPLISLSLKGGGSGRGSGSN